MSAHVRIDVGELGQHPDHLVGEARPVRVAAHVAQVQAQVGKAAALHGEQVAPVARVRVVAAELGGLRAVAGAVRHHRHVLGDAVLEELQHGRVEVRAAHVHGLAGLVRPQLAAHGRAVRAQHRRPPRIGPVIARGAEAHGRVHLDAHEALRRDRLLHLGQVVLSRAERLPGGELAHGVEADQGEHLPLAVLVLAQRQLRVVLHPRVVEAGVGQPAVHVHHGRREQVARVGVEHRVGDGLHRPPHQVGVGEEALEDVAVLRLLEVGLVRAIRHGCQLGPLLVLGGGELSTRTRDQPLDHGGEAPGQAPAVVQELLQRDVPAVEDVAVHVHQGRGLRRRRQRPDRRLGPGCVLAALAFFVLRGGVLFREPIPALLSAAARRPPGAA